MQNMQLLSMVTASQGTTKRHSNTLSRRICSAHRASLEALLEGLVGTSEHSRGERKEENSI